MTEVPEHLLRRSRERRAALGLGGEESGEAPSAEAPAAAPAAPAEASAAAPVVVEPAGLEPAGGAAVAATARGGGAPPVAEPPAVAEPPGRPAIPVFAVVLLAALPIYAFVYMGAFGNRHGAGANNPVTLGATLFAANCASCHGSNGEGGVGPQLANGAVLKTWPNVEDHVKWVHTGGAPYVGKTYGAQGHSVSANNVMPAFGQDHGGSLTDAQIVDIVCYERIGLGGAPQDAANCPALGAGAAAAG